MSCYGIVTGTHNLDMVESALGERGLTAITMELFDGGADSGGKAEEGRFYDDVSFVDELISRCDANRPACVLSNCIDDHATVVESQFVDLLSARNIPFAGHPFRAASIAIDKSKTKDLCNALGIATAKGYVVRSAADLREGFFDVDDLVVCKRLNGSSGDDQRMIRADSLFTQLDASRGPYLLEKFVDGHEVSVNVFATKDGLCSLPVMLKGPTRRDNVHPLDRVRLISPPDDNMLQATVMKACEQLCESLNPNGWLEFEFVLAADNLYLLEINARYSGTTRAGYLATAINPYLVALDYALSGIIPAKRTAQRFVAELPLAAGLAPGAEDEYIVYYSSRPRPGRLGRQILIADSLRELLEKIKRYAPVALRDQYRNCVLSYVNRASI